MRVIAGLYKGRVLKSPPGLKTRPTSDRLRETLFNILAPEISGKTRFLDLCAGTGAVGIEALSRGAAFCGLVDKSRKACGLIEANLDILGVPEDMTEVIMADASEFLKKTEHSFDIIFYDPPYEADYFEVLENLGRTGSKTLAGAGVLIAEHRTRDLMPDAVGELRRWRIVKQGDSSLSFFSRH